VVILEKPNGFAVKTAKISLRCSCHSLLDSVATSLIPPSSELDHGGPLAFPMQHAKLSLGAEHSPSLSMEPRPHPGSGASSGMERNLSPSLTGLPPQAMVHGV